MQMVLVLKEVLKAYLLAYSLYKAAAPDFFFYWYITKFLIQ